MFRLTVFIIVSGLQFLLYTRALRWARQRFPGSTKASVILAAPFVFFSAGLIATLFAGPVASHFPAWLINATAPPFYIWEGGTIMLGLVILAGMLLAAPVRLAGAALKRIPLTAPAYKRAAAHPAVVRFDGSRRAFLLRGMEGVAVVSFGGAAYGMVSGRTGYEFTEATIPVPRLPPALDGFTIGLLSDIHSSTFMTKKQMDVYCKAVMALGTDIIVIPGDFVNSQTEEVYPFAESFSALHAPGGVYGVMGNHDFYAPDPERVATEVDGCGVRLLRNDNVIIAKNGARLALLGIDDVGRADRAAAHMQSAARGVPDVLPRILLCHRPYYLQQASSQGMDLVLSGHTHGGQIVLGHLGPVALTPAALASPYVWGRYSRGNTQMYVSRGIGTVGLPMRINCPPEITRITLRRAADVPEADPHA